ncbi:MAG: DUF4446 family protein [Ruminococcaceae bacterium]|nr:DUF4446 family protein [Oscillospiraceae bacterium]
MDFYGFYIPEMYIVIAEVGLCFLAFLFGLIALIIAAKAGRRSKKILRCNEGYDISRSISSYYEKCAALMENYQAAEERLQKLEKNSKAAAKKIGALRYNAFGGNNGNLSYAVAVLDEEDTGFVLNGVYTSQQTATYLKPIKNGHSAFELSEEEQEAILKARENYTRIINE